ncbi:MAG: lysylphosphatidylglycerol synthase transmembrane domain-containing protein [Candidatus Nitrosotenuis sp.]
MKAKGKLIFGLLLSSIAILWIIWKVDFREVVETIKHINFFFFIFAGIIYLIGFLPRGLRWQLMLSTITKVSVYDSTETVVLGYAANNLLPFRLGEVVRAYVMGNRNNVSKVTCLGSIATERIFDGVVIVSLFGLSILYLEGEIHEMTVLNQIFFAGGVIFLLSIFSLFIFVKFSEIVLRLWKKTFGSFGQDFLVKVLKSLEFFHNKGLLLKVLILSIIIWLIEGSMFVLILWVMGLENPVIMGYFCLGVVNLSILLPSVPGYFGVFQAASVFAFLTLGYSKSTGLAYGLIIHLAQYIPITLAGVVVFFKFGYKFNDFYKTIKY